MKSWRWRAVTASTPRRGTGTAINHTAWRAARTLKQMILIRARKRSWWTISFSRCSGLRFGSGGASPTPSTREAIMIGGSKSKGSGLFSPPSPSLVEGTRSACNAVVVVVGPPSPPGMMVKGEEESLRLRTVPWVPVGAAAEVVDLDVVKPSPSWFTGSAALLL